MIEWILIKRSGSRNETMVVEDGKSKKKIGQSYSEQQKSKIIVEDGKTRK